MSILGSLTSGWKLRNAKKLAAKAKQAEPSQADESYASAYAAFAAIIESHSTNADAYYQWGLALLNQAQTRSEDSACALLEEAVEKFDQCSAIQPDYLGAAIDRGYALLSLAKAKHVSLDDELYTRAREAFLKADDIQEGAAAYNLACLHALRQETDDCFAALEKARDLKLIPDVAEILQDNDLANVKGSARFDDFIESLQTKTEEEPEKSEKPTETEPAATVAEEQATEAPPAAETVATETSDIPVANTAVDEVEPENTPQEPEKQEQNDKPAS